MRSGETLGGKYVLEQLLGKGGMGVVWAAYNVETQQKVAVKLIIPQNEESLTKELRQRLLREAGACAKLQHPNIIQVYEVGETDEGDAYMVLELLDGQALGDVLKQKRRLEPKLAARIAADIASGLSEAHAAKVVHRDLKPANIFLHREPGMGEDEFVTKVLDFGVCIDRESMDTVKTKTDIIVGSPAYMSPEQMAMRKDIDGRTDIWSLGLLLYEMVTGMRVFNGTVLNVRAQIFMQDVPAPSSKVRDVPQDLDAVVARCTQRKRELRYAEASELARDLYVIAGKRPTVRQPSTSRPSLVQQIGLAQMFDAEIRATPVVPKPGSARTFNPMGATIPLIQPVHRGEMENLPPVIDEADDLAATLPLQAHMLATMRPKALEEEPDAALGTQLLRPSDPIPSPEPAWKQEMEQALEVHRQSSASLSLIELEAPQEVVDGTQVLSAEAHRVRPDAPFRPDATGTTSVASSMSQEVRFSSTSTMDPLVVTGRRLRRNRNTLYGAAGLLVASFALLLGVVAYRDWQDAKPEPIAGPVSSGPLPLPPMTIESAAVEASASVRAPAEAPSAMTVPVSSAKGAPAVAPTNSATGAPAATNAPTAKPSSAAPIVKPPGTGKMPAKVVMVESCSGVGLFRRCKKGPAP